MTTEKRCTDCKTTKPISEFNKNKSENDGYAHICKECRKVRSRERYEKNKDVILQKNAERRKDNPEPSRRAARESQRRSRERARQEPAVCQRCGVSMEKIKHSHNKFCAECKVQNQKDAIAAYYLENRQSILDWNREYAKDESRNANRRKNYENYKSRHATEIVLKRKERLAKIKDDPEYIASRLASSLKHRSERGTTSKEHILHLYKWQEGCCYYCNREIPKGFRTRQMDHIVPIALGGSADPKNIALACHECNSVSQKGAHLLEREWEPVSLNDSHTIYSPIRKMIAAELEEYGITISWEDDVLIANGVRIHALSTFWASERYLPNASEIIEELEGVILYDYEWMNRQDAWLNVLLAKCGACETIAARKTTVSEIDFEEAKAFVSKYHIQGFLNSTLYVGLHYKENLVGVATFSLKQDQWELNRLVFSGRVVGGFGKLLAYFTRNYQNGKKLLSYVDPRHGDGKSYLKLGFKPRGETPQPMYFYATPDGLYHRLSGSQGRMERDADYFEKALPEVLLNKINGRYRVYGKRQLRFVLAPASY
jgi:protein-arginine kinase activator protein McsA